MNMKKLFFISSLYFFSLFLNRLWAQNVVQELYFNKIKWHIALPYGPNGFSILDSMKESKLEQKGKAEIESSTGKKLNLNKKTIKLFSAIKNGFNYLDASLDPYSGNKTAWERAVKNSKNIITKTFQNKFNAATIDTLTTIDTINNLLFDKFTVTLSNTGGKPFFHLIFYNAILAKYEFAITSVYMNETIGKEIEKIIKGSYFDK